MAVNFDKYPEIGEMNCPVCGKFFKNKKSLVCHYGGAHRRNISAGNKLLICKKCGKSLIKGKTWAESAIKQRNLICINCTNEKNRRSYYKRKKLNV